MSRQTHFVDDSPLIGLLIIKLSLPDCNSLKEKRSCLLSLLSRLHKEFPITVSEIGLQDIWHSALIGVAILSNDQNYNSAILQKTIPLIEHQFPQVQVEEFHFETR